MTLDLNIRGASLGAGGVGVVEDAAGVFAHLETNVAFFSPASTPGVLHKVVVSFLVPDGQDGMVDAGGALVSHDNTAGVGLHGGGIHADRDGLGSHGSGQLGGGA